MELRAAFSFIRTVLFTLGGKESFSKEPILFFQKLYLQCVRFKNRIEFFCRFQEMYEYCQSWKSKLAEKHVICYRFISYSLFS